MSNQISETTDGIPISDGFDFPVGPRGSDVDVFKTHKIDSTLADPAYYKSFGVWHTGEDWNGRGGGDTDLGDPIYAISHGRVAGIGYYPPAWGNLILLEHALPDGSRVWSQYAHLDQMMVSEVGQKITRGQQIGTMGKGAKTSQYPRGRWIAHLHFEIRRKKLPINNWTPMVRNRDDVLANYFSPTPFINARRPAVFSQRMAENTTSTDPLRHVFVDSQQTDPAAGRFRKAQAKNWYVAPYGYQGSTLWTFGAATEETHWAEWRVFLPKAGYWSVWTFIPEDNADTTNARYTIVHTKGKQIVSVDQSKLTYNWAYLGTYGFEKKGGYVRLSDLTGEQGLTPTKVAFDTICWTKVE